MAEGEDGFQNSKNYENLSSESSPDLSDQSNTKTDFGAVQPQQNTNENSAKTPKENEGCSSKSGGATRKEENPFSFRHFLKRDLSLPGSSCYESTGARPKVYASTVQVSACPPSPVEPPEPRRDRAPRETPTQAKDPSREGSSHRLSDNTTSSSSIELPFSVADKSESKNNLYTENSENFYQRPSIASEPLGMPSLPDFVQDHILVEQAYLNTNGPISVDLDNLPDFTFNTNYNAGPSSWNQRNYGGSSRGYDYEEYAGAAGSSGEQPARNVPLDLPVGAEAAGLPLDLAPHLNLDLTESVNPADRRNNSPRNTFPLDLPPNAGAESMRLPDFLPMHPGRTSPEPEHGDEQLQQILYDLERTRSELFTERTRRSQVESELVGARLSIEVLESRASKSRATEEALRARLQEARGEDQAGQLGAAAASGGEDLVNYNVNTGGDASEPDPTTSELKKEIKRLKEALASSREEARSLRNTQSLVSRDLRQASSVAEISLRDLLAGLEQLRTLSATLDPT